MKAVYYDTETTGTRPEKDRIIELAAYDPEGNKTFCELINPGIRIPPEATAIHKITDEMVAGARSFAEVGMAFIEFCGTDALLIAHNNDAFDKPFIDSEFARHGLTMPPWKTIDTLKWSRKYRYDLPKHSLQFLRETYGIAANQAHRALDDVEVLSQVFSYMIGDLTFDQVLELLSRKDQVLRMPFGKHQGKALSDIPKDYVAWLKASGAFEKRENESLKEAFVNLGLYSN